MKSKIKKVVAKPQLLKITPKFSTLAPISKLQKALDILNKNPKTEYKQDYCKFEITRSNNYTMVDRCTIHYCRLINHAILNHKWNDVAKLLSAYIDEPKSEKITAPVLYRTTLIYLLNDPAAQAHGLLNEFLQLGLSCQSDKDRSDFLKILMTLPKINNT